MKFAPVTKIVALGSVSALLFAGCANNEAPAGPAENSSGTSNTQTTDTPELSGELVGAGASSQGAAQEAWIANFQTANSGVTVNYDPSGSGAGREQFQQGASLFAGSDRAFKMDEITEGPFGSCADGSDLVEFPAYISPIAIAFNLEGVDSLNLDAATLGNIFSGKITNWNDPAIVAQNPDVQLPDLAIAPVHRSDKSGTTQNFTDYLSKAAPDAWTEGDVEEWPAGLGGEAAQGTSGVVSAIEAGNGTIGYADASRTGNLATVNVKVGEEYVPYSPAAAAAIVDASPIEEGRASSDLAIKLDRTSDAEGVYPIVLISYLIGCAEYKNADDAMLVKEYFRYVASEDGQNVAASEAGSAPLSAELRSQVESIIDSIK